MVGWMRGAREGNGTCPNCNLGRIFACKCERGTYGESTYMLVHINCGAGIVTANMGTMLKTLETTNHKIEMMIHDLVEVNELILG